MNRKLILGAVGGAVIVAGAAALYGISRQGADRASDKPSAVKPAAVLTPAQSNTPRFWAARVTTLGGDGAAGFADGAASRFGDPFGVAVTPRGNVYVADGGEVNRIRTIAPDGTVTTLAGGREGYADGKGASAMFDTPSAIALDHLGNLYVADTGNHAVRKVTPDGTVTTLAGNGQAGHADGIGAAARFNGPVGIAVDDTGVVYVADTYNDRIRRIAPDGTVTTVAGSGRPGDADGAAAQAGFDTPSGVAVGTDGALYVADTGNNAVRRIGTDGRVTTLAEAPEGERRPLLRRPVGIAATRDGYLYVTAGGGGRVLQFAPDGSYRPLGDADHPLEPGYGSDGSVQFSAPRGVAVARDGAVVVAEGLGFAVVRLAPPQPGTRPPVERRRAATPSRKEAMPWPVLPQDQPHEVVGLMGEVRGNFDGESRDHFHNGLDVRADVGQSVVAIAAAKVTDPFPNWGYATLSEGLSIGTLSYIHMKVGRDRRDRALDARFTLVTGARNKPERVRVRRGTRFAVGDVLGTINGMAHVHLDYFPTGGVENALTLPFIGLQDTVAPKIQSIVLLADGGRRLGAPREKPVRKVKSKKGARTAPVTEAPAAGPARRVKIPAAVGKVDIVVDAWDQMDGNLERRRLGLYKLGYQLLREDGSAMPGYEQPRITQVYDRLPRNPDAVKLLYAASSGITVYGSKATHFAYALNNSLLDGRAQPGVWEVSGIAPGHYTLRIYAADYAGNVAVEGRDLPIAIE
ncbi:DNA-binding beta-propeller fold protein YncE [Pseudoduganella lurida]|uniref:DNA-binding beta-propeller fold protein YncE n=1 Tax=Pseudoduganella lurida TaxID=1036180 RepID=A0A562RK97_9BURK|nr:NHL repeat-containing protein [Pseudoduganella lurida]TWI69469.1 DNA-binding beta-propeller fold protein YncE [Pseudoduganella lurida]